MDEAKGQGQDVSSDLNNIIWMLLNMFYLSRVQAQASSCMCTYICNPKLIGPCDVCLRAGYFKVLYKNAA